MLHYPWRLCAGLSLCCLALAQTPHPLTWPETVERFRANNPTLAAGRVTIDQARATEITAHMRPNPNVSAFLDQITPQGQFQRDVTRPLSQAYPNLTISYLHERQHKRELRLQSAQAATLVSIANQNDLERTLLFALRDAFNRVLLAKALVAVSRDNLAYYDRLVAINRDRLRAGDLARVDFVRVELQRAEFEADLQTSTVNVRTALLDLQRLLDDHTPTDQFDVGGVFEFEEPQINRDELRAIALASRPDVIAARQDIERAQADHRLAIANGAADISFGLLNSHQPDPFNTYFGGSVAFPLKIFDRNQGEKLRTALDIDRTQRNLEAARTTAQHDVDAAWATLDSTISLLRPYKTVYLKDAQDVRETISFSFQKGAASLVDFLDAQRQYRATQIAYLNLVGAYFSAANLLNEAVAREVIP